MPYDAASRAHAVARVARWAVTASASPHPTNTKSVRNTARPSATSDHSQYTRINASPAREISTM
ncbi:hypothetical protein [Cryptosporangium japonicum]|uniref:hypothetical protein n=1 Tax=Cryptosporangium japonicum TaxID=80872 RepID=UPI0031DFEBB0